MARLDADKLARELERGRRGGVFLLHGDEEYLKEEAAARLIDVHLDAATRDFNLDVLRGTSLDAETLASICNTPPMMAEWRVVVIRDAQGLAGSARLRGIIDSLAAAPPPGLALILLATIGGSKAKFWVDLERRARSVHFPITPAADLPDWLMRRAESAGIQLEPRAARALAAAAGPGLGALVTELDKLIDYAAGRGIIRVEDVTAVVGNVPAVNRWDWIDTVGERGFAKARSQLAQLLAAGDSGVGLVIGLGTRMLRIGLAAAGGKRALERWLPPNQKFLAPRILAQARNWSAAEADAAIGELLRADRLLKSGGTDYHVLDELLLRLQAATSS